jgi:Berberine and berberine like
MLPSTSSPISSLVSHRDTPSWCWSIMAKVPCSAVPDSATAFGHRNWPYNILVTSAWSASADTDRNVAWTREFFEAMGPFTAKAAYVNYIGDEGPEGMNAAYGAEKLARLAEIKVKYDPLNFFRMNQNITPASVA